MKKFESTVYYFKNLNIEEPFRYRSDIQRQLNLTSQNTSSSESNRNKYTDILTVLIGVTKVGENRSYEDDPQKSQYYKISDYV